jgi:O-antigen ligase
MNSIPKQYKQYFWGFGIFQIACIAISIIFQQVIWLVLPLIVLAGAIAIFNTKFFYYALILALPISVNLMEFGYFSLDFPDEPLLLIITAFFPFLFIINRQSVFNHHFFRHPIIGLLLVWFFWMIICTITSTYPLLSLKYLLVKIWYLFPFVGMTILVVYHNVNSIKTIFLLYFIPFVLLILMVTYKHSLLGFRFEDVTKACAPIFRNHVVYGTLTSLFVPLSIGALFSQKRFSRNWFLALLGVVIVFIGLYLAYSRGAWAAIVFAGAIAFGMRFKLVQYGFGLFYISIFVTVLFLQSNNKYIDFAPRYETGVMHDKLVDHLIATIKGKDISSNERFYRWVAGARMSAEKPLFGFGPNTFYQNYKPYTVNLFRTYVSRNKEQSTMHNYFLFMLVEQGYIGMFIYALFIFVLFYRAQLLYHLTENKQLKIMIMSITCMLGAFFINNSLSELIENDKIGGCFLIGIGMLVAIDLKRINRVEGWELEFKG